MTHPEAFWSRVDKSGDCWSWLGYIDQGYGRFFWNGRYTRAHRFAYELLVGPIPEGLTIDHLCRNRRCVNPAHMEPVTSTENVMRGKGRTATNARKTHCKRGHVLSGPNLKVESRGFRSCRTCYNKMRQEHRASRAKVA